jgi:hypothetical protein
MSTVDGRLSIRESAVPPAGEGAKGVQLAELALRSSDERRWIDVPELVP